MCACVYTSVYFMVKKVIFLQYINYNYFFNIFKSSNISGLFFFSSSEHSKEKMLYTSGTLDSFSDFTTCCLPLFFFLFVEKNYSCTMQRIISRRKFFCFPTADNLLLLSSGRFKVWLLSIIRWHCFLSSAVVTSELSLSYWPEDCCILRVAYN